MCIRDSKSPNNQMQKVQPQMMFGQQIQNPPIQPGQQVPVTIFKPQRDVPLPQGFNQNASLFQGKQIDKSVDYVTNKDPYSGMPLKFPAQQAPASVSPKNIQQQQNQQYFQGGFQNAIPAYQPKTVGLPPQQQIDPRQFAQQGMPSKPIQEPSNVEYIQEKYSDGSVYQGEKKNGVRHGKGKFYYADGGVYDGEWQIGYMDGFGTLYYPGNKIAYQGQFKNDKFNGKGVVYNESPVPLNGMLDYSNFDSLEDHWVKYEGTFVEDNKDGSGTLYLVNGEKFIGGFKDDMIHGKGVFQRLDGKTVQGQWVNNNLTLVYYCLLYTSPSPRDS
eukprot:TRINITY_DN6275_c0_g1_i3.p1 TRINITY_DN6275_c0_g1~~TRINITY_DN6275_c0_g1_i3.p1  ORF type:complete len:329 (+),score=47.84 TRINITY_DN6275_c0_g1_i3:66-1052(+)